MKGSMRMLRPWVLKVERFWPSQLLNGASGAFRLTKAKLFGKNSTIKVKYEGGLVNGITPMG